MSKTGEEVIREDERVVEKMSPEEKEKLYRQLKQWKKRQTTTVDQIADRDERRAQSRSLEDEYSEIEEQANKQREPALIEAEAVERMASAMHHPGRMEALLHTHLPQKILSNMGELEAIERDSIALWKAQLEELDRLTDPNGPDNTVPAGHIRRLKELVVENDIHLKGIMQAVDDAFELALAATDKGRAEHAVKNIASVVAGARSQVDFEAEGARNLWRRLKDRMSRGGFGG